MSHHTSSACHRGHCFTRAKNRIEREAEAFAHAESSCAPDLESGTPHNSQLVGPELSIHDPDSPHVPESSVADDLSEDASSKESTPSGVDDSLTVDNSSFGFASDDDADFLHDAGNADGLPEEDHLKTTLPC